MNTCQYCKWSEGAHDPACPAVIGRTEDYQRGRRAGYRRQPVETNANGTYRLGHVRGDTAADESENGERVWGC